MKKNTGTSHARESMRETTHSRSIRMIRAIQSARFDDDSFCIYARGNTFKSKKYIKSLRTVFPIDVRLVESTRSGVWRIIPIPAPNYFVIRINDAGVLEEFYNSINDLSIINFYIFSRYFEELFLDKLTKDKNLAYIGPLEEDRNYFVYGVDTDDQDSESGHREFVSYGSNAPKELVSLAEWQ